MNKYIESIKKRLSSNADKLSEQEWITQIEDGINEAAGDDESIYNKACNEWRKLVDSLIGQETDVQESKINSFLKKWKIPITLSNFEVIDDGIYVDLEKTSKKVEARKPKSNKTYPSIGEVWEDQEGVEVEITSNEEHPFIVSFQPVLVEGGEEEIDLDSFFAEYTFVRDAPNDWDEGIPKESSAGDPSDNEFYSVRVTLDRDGVDSIEDKLAEFGIGWDEFDEHGEGDWVLLNMTLETYNKGKSWFDKNAIDVEHHKDNYAMKKKSKVTVVVPTKLRNRVENILEKGGVAWDDFKVFDNGLDGHEYVLRDKDYDKVSEALQKAKFKIKAALKKTATGSEDDEFLDGDYVSVTDGASGDIIGNGYVSGDYDSTIDEYYVVLDNGEEMGCQPAALNLLERETIPKKKDDDFPDQDGWNGFYGPYSNWLNALNSFSDEYGNGVDVDLEESAEGYKAYLGTDCIGTWDNARGWGEIHADASYYEAEYLNRKSSKTASLEDEDAPYDAAQAVSDAEAYYRDTLKGKVVPDQDDIINTAAEFLCNEYDYDFDDCVDSIQAYFKKKKKKAVKKDDDYYPTYREYVLEDLKFSSEDLEGEDKKAIRDAIRALKKLPKDASVKEINKAIDQYGFFSESLTIAYEQNVENEKTSKKRSMMNGNDWELDCGYMIPVKDLINMRAKSDNEDQFLLRIKRSLDNVESGVELSKEDENQLRRVFYDQDWNSDDDCTVASNESPNATFPDPSKSTSPPTLPFNTGLTGNKKESLKKKSLKEGDKVKYDSGDSGDGLNGERVIIKSIEGDEATVYTVGWLDAKDNPLTEEEQTYIVPLDCLHEYNYKKSDKDDIKYNSNHELSKILK